jgi:hypothetical protein
MDVNFKNWCKLFYLSVVYSAFCISFLKVLKHFKYWQLDSSYEYDNDKKVNLQKFPVRMWNNEA